nr:flagellar brake protein [Thauera sp.]
MTDTTTTPPQDEAASHEAPAEHKGFSFADMHLAVGDRLQIECPAGTGLGRAFVRVIGYVDHLSILVTAPVAGNRRIDLVENDLVVVRVFSRENAFAFRASVLRACRLPFHYVHLSFPEIIQGSVIRKATRVRTELPVSVSVEQPGADATPGTVLNISASGLLLRTRAALGDRGSPVRLRFELPLHGIDTRLE